MITSIQIEGIHFYPGIRAGLSTKTAIVKITSKGKLEASEIIRSEFIKNFKALAPADDFYSAMTLEWEKHFLLHPPEKTGLAHWITGVTIAMQLWARDPVWKGSVLKNTKDIMILALPWERQEVFNSALSFALDFIVLWADTKSKTSTIQQLTNKYNIWLSNAQMNGLAPNTLRFAYAALQRNIPVTLQTPQIQLGFGKNSIKMNSSFTSNTSVIGSKIARDKLQTNRLLRASHIPVPLSALANSYEDALELIKKIPFPVVIKPSNQEQGIGITTNIRDPEKLRNAFILAKKYSSQGVIIEQHIQGDDHRLLIIGGKCLIATKRVPGGVIGDGKNNIEQLLTLLNKDPLRGKSKRSLLMQIALDNEAKTLLKEQNLTAQTVPKKGQFIQLRHTANLSSGGTAVDVTEIVHPDNLLIAQRAAQVIGLDIAGIDFLCNDISKSWRQEGGVVIEVNAQPGFRPHWTSVPERDINGEIIDWLFQDKPIRIPTAAITGTNGKTTTAKMLHHIWMTSGKNAGIAATNGIWIGNNIISDENLSGNPGGRILLNDPTVEAAIIEMPRKGLIVFGHPCNQYDVSALLNIQNDHIGANGINSLKEMATLKSEVIHRAKQAVVINAEDTLCMQIAQNINYKKLILISTNENLPLFVKHIQREGIGISTKKIKDIEWIILKKGTAEINLMPVADIPATLNGHASFNISNAMFAIGLALAQNLSLDTIRKGLSTFESSIEKNPGRMNFIEGFPFKLLLDFSHNPDTVKSLTQFIKKIKVKGKKRVLIQNVGNRHRSHFKESAADLAQTFDEFIIGCRPKTIKKNLAWGENDPIGTMLKVSKESLLAEGIPNAVITIEADEAQAIRSSIENSEHGDLLVLLADVNIAKPIIKKAIIK